MTFEQSMRGKSRLVLSVAFLVLILSAGAPAFAKKGGGGKGSKIPVKVTFRDQIPEPSDGLMSDCQTGDCSYIDREMTVSASVGSSFRLKLTRGDRPKTAERGLWLDFTQCVSVPSEDCMVEGELAAEPAAAGFSSLGLDMRQMLPGEQRDMGLILRLDLFPEDEVLWIFFTGNMSCPEGSPVKVTRGVDLQAPDTWEIEAGPLSRACLVRTLGSPTNNVFSGLYHLPFAMTVERK